MTRTGADNTDLDALLAFNVMVMKGSQIISIVKYSMIMDVFPNTFVLYI